MRRSLEPVAAFVCAMAFVAILLVPAIFISDPNPIQYAAIRVGLTAAGAGFAATALSFFSNRNSMLLRASTAIAVATLVYFVSPMALQTPPASSIAAGRDSAAASKREEKGANRSAHSSAAASRTNTQQVLPREQSAAEKEKMAKTLLRVELALRSIGRATTDNDGIHIDLLKGKTVVGSGLAFAGTRTNKNAARTASVMIIPPVAFDNDWTLKIRRSGTVDRAFRIEQIKGYFEDGTAKVLHGPTAEIRLQNANHPDPTFPLRRT